MNRMRSGLLAVFAAVALGSYAPPADACGVKLTIKTSQARKAVARSSRPSHVLLVGAPPRRLERDLSAAGHEVEVAANPSSAKLPTYAVVIVSSDDEAQQARAKFRNSTIVLRSGDIAADLKSVETVVARAPISVATSRTVVAAGPDTKAPINQMAPKDTKSIISSKEPTETKQPVAAPPAPEPTPPPAPTPPPQHEAVTASEPPKDETPAPKPASTASLDSEVYFAVGSAKVAGSKDKIAKAAKWLASNPQGAIVVEGYADPTGNPDANMALSQSRAEAVRDILVSGGVDSARIDVMAYGDTRLKYGRSDGRNRRVAIQPKK